MAKFLVTGGCGFIGSHLADALVRRGDRVFILDDLSTGKIANRPRHAQLVVGDVRDPSAVAELMAEVDGCFHLAAIASVERTNRDWPNTHRTNLGGTVAVLDAAWRVRVHAPIPVVYASSAAVYGSNPAMPLRESSVAMPVSAYGADKLGSELHARAGGVVHNIPTLGLRLFNVYGPRQDLRSPYSGVISIFRERLRRHRPIDVFGDGYQARDFIHVSDVVAAFLAGMEKASTSAPVVNVCTGRGTTLRELIASLAAALGVAPEVRHCPSRAGDIRCSLGDTRRLHSFLNIRPSMLLETAFAEWDQTEPRARPPAAVLEKPSAQAIEVNTA